MTPPVALALDAPRRVGLGTRRFVWVVAGVVLLLGATYLVGPLYSDEAGYYVVASAWRPGGSGLHGHYFIDRPPLLLAVFWLAHLTGWAQTARVLSAGFAVVLVLSAAWAAQSVVGGRGARWAALTAGGAATTPPHGVPPLRSRRRDLCTTPRTPVTPPPCCEGTPTPRLRRSWPRRTRTAPPGWSSGTPSTRGAWTRTGAPSSRCRRTIGGWPTCAVTRCGCVRVSTAACHRRRAGPRRRRQPRPSGPDSAGEIR